MDVYSIVNEKIISLLEAGVVPWRKPWTSAGLPRNLVSKKFLSRYKCLPAFCVEVQFTILADPSAG
jgi:antirestriction protein ArdC